MNIKLLALSLGGTLLAQASLACSPPPQMTPPPLPAGLDGRLPVTYPDKDPNFPYIPPVSNGQCPVQLERYTNQASLPGLNDAETDRVYGAANPLTPVWDAGKVYNTGDLASLDGITYKAKWWTQNEKPGQAWGAWEVQSSGNQGAGPQPWSSSKAYSGGEQAAFNGRIYQAKWWTQNNPPDQAGSPWEDKGALPVSSTSRPPQFSAQINRQADGSLKASFVSPQTVYLITFTEKVGAACRTEVHVDTSSTGLPTPVTMLERWEVRIDGKVVSSLPGPQAIRTPSVLPPAPRYLPSNPDGSCSVAEGTVLSKTTHPNGMVFVANTDISASNAAGNYASVWLCNGDACRPSTLLAKYRFAQPIWP
ncbi:carbohydrate-binding protein [Chitinibacter sp. FCG-7]|uniref:Carbohydrate-binding protein n=1 Tax=Chitinibacter mangrovi TaxID=3153927 RepID=A0AAU7FCH8_9NEIS